MDKEFTEESIRFKANEILLSSKGFILFTIDHAGKINCVGNSSKLNPAEQYGMIAYARNFDPSQIGDSNEM